MLANGAGAALGASLLTQARRGRWSPERVECLGARASLAAACALLLTAALAEPVLPAPPYFGHFVPDLAHFAPYGGEVARAELGGHALSHGPLSDPKAVRDALSRPYSLAIDLRAGASPPDLAGLLLVTDLAEREVLLVGVDGGDLVLRYLDAGAFVGLEPRTLRARGALAEAVPGERVRLDLAREADGFRVGVDAHPAVLLSSSLGRGWALVLPPRRLSERATTLLDAAWLGLLSVAFGLRGAASRRHAWRVLALAALMAALPHASFLRDTPALEWCGAALGVAAGLSISRILARRERGAPAAEDGRGPLPSDRDTAPRSGRP